MSETNYFIAAGESLDVVHKFRKWWDRGADASDILKRDFVTGDILCLWANQSRVFGFGLRDGAKPPKGLRIDKKKKLQETPDGETVAIIVPDRRTKKGREIDKRMEQTSRGGSTDLARMLGLNSLFPGTRGYRVPGIGIEQFGDDWVLEVLEDYNFEPPGALPMKRSAYWARKEAQEGPKEKTA